MTDKTINYATYAERVKNVRRELRSIELADVGQPLSDADAESVLNDYCMIADRVVSALLELGIDDLELARRVGEIKRGER